MNAFTVCMRWKKCCCCWVEYCFYDFQFARVLGSSNPAEQGVTWYANNKDAPGGMTAALNIGETSSHAVSASNVERPRAGEFVPVIAYTVSTRK